MCTVWPWSGFTCLRRITATIYRCALYSRTTIDNRSDFVEYHNMPYTILHNVIHVHDYNATITCTGGTVQSMFVRVQVNQHPTGFRSRYVSCRRRRLSASARAHTHTHIHKYILFLHPGRRNHTSARIHTYETIIECIWGGRSTCGEARERYSDRAIEREGEMRTHNIIRIILCICVCMCVCVCACARAHLFAAVQWSSKRTRGDVYTRINIVRTCYDLTESRN